MVVALRRHGQPVTAEQLAYVARAARAAGEPFGWIVPDTNVVLHQFDLLEHAATKCAPLDRLVVAQTVLDEVKHNDGALFRRLCTLIGDARRSNIAFPNEHSAATKVDEAPVVGETINDRNDRAIRLVAAFLGAELTELKAAAFESVVLLTDDRACRDQARVEGVRALSTKELCEACATLAPSLADVLAVRDDGDGDDEADGSRRGARKKKKKLYDPHLAMSALLAGVAKGTYFQGALRCDRRTCWKAYVDVADDQGDVLVKGSEQINRAVDGDVVAIELIDDEAAAAAPAAPLQPSEDAAAAFPEAAAQLAADCGDEDEASSSSPSPSSSSSLKKERLGRVVGVIRRNWRQVCGSLEVPEGASTAELDDLRRALFVPVDRRCPKVVVESRQLSRLAGQRLLVAMDAWRDDSRWPSGHYVASLGPVGDKAVETDVLLREHDIATADFSTEVLACLPPQGDQFVISDEERARRLDLRALTICSIDPPGCRDIDDALHAVGPLPNGAYQIGIHIADVTHFCKPDSALDREAARRGTSTYLVERRLDMLPVLLTANLCSLRAEVERLAFSCLVEITEDGEVLKADFAKSVIRSRAALTYHQAQLMIDGGSSSSFGGGGGEKEPGEDPSTTVAESVRILAKIARALRARRLAAGALTLASPEVRFELSNESDSPTDVGAYQLVEANATVEEFMLLGNVLVAKRCLEAYPALTVLRHHPSPALSKFDKLVDLAQTVDIDLRVATSRDLADSLDAAVRPEDPYLNKLLRILSTRCMAPAKYFCSSEKAREDWLHYGLAAPVYTHFTSPIRRYADVIVHRLLAAAIGFAPLPRDYSKADAKAELAKVTQNLNRRNKAAQMAGRDSVALYTRLYFRDHPQDRIEARILTVDQKRIDVLVPRFGIEGPVHLPAPSEDSTPTVVVVVDEKTHQLRWTSPTTGRDVVLRVFDKVFISIVVEKPQSAAEDVGHIKFALVDPVLPGPAPPANPSSSSSSSATAAAAAAASSAPEKKGPKRQKTTAH